MSSDDILRLLIVFGGIFGAFDLGIRYERAKQRARNREVREWLENMFEEGDIKVEKIKEIKEKEEKEDKQND